VIHQDLGQRHSLKCGPPQVEAGIPCVNPEIPPGLNQGFHPLAGFGRINLAEDTVLDACRLKELIVNQHRLGPAQKDVAVVLESKMEAGNDPVLGLVVKVD